MWLFGDHNTPNRHLLRTHSWQSPRSWFKRWLQDPNNLRLLMWMLFLARSQASLLPLGMFGNNRILRVFQQSTVWERRLCFRKPLWLGSQSFRDRKTQSSWRLREMNPCRTWQDCRNNYRCILPRVVRKHLSQSAVLAQLDLLESTPSSLW